MKGIIINLLEAVVTQAHGADMWDDLLVDADVDGSFTALGNYPDADVVALVSALAERTGSDVPSVLRGFGSAAIPLLADRYPAFFEPVDPVAFVVTLDDIIHTEVMKLYPGATPPELSFRDVTGQTVTIDYRSRRAMSDLAIGFLEGAAAHYGQTVEVDRTVLDDTGTAVQLRCTFTNADQAA